MQGMLRSLIGSKNDRELKRMFVTAARINEFEPTMRGLDDEQLAEIGPRLKQRVASGESLDEILPECFAAVA